MIANATSVTTVSTAKNAFGQLLRRARGAAGALIRLVLVAPLAVPLLAHAAVTQLGAPASYYGLGPTTGTLANFTAPAGTNRLLVVTASNTAYQNTTVVNFGATPMTKVVEKNDSFVASDSIWVLKLGTGGLVTASITATFANQVAPLPPGQEVYLSAVVFSGVDQTTPTSSPVSVNTLAGTNLPSTLTVTSAVGDLVYDIFDAYRTTAASATAAAGQTVVVNNGGAITGGGFVAYTNSSQPGAASVPMSWTSNAEAIIQAAINIRQAAASPDLTITKAANGTFQQGGTASYTVTVTNSGSGPTTASFAVADTMPTGLTMASIATDATWNCTASTSTVLNCTRTTALAAGASSAITLQVSIAANAPASITNTATVSGGGELVTNNNSGSSTVSVTQISPDLIVTKAANGTFQQGGSASYTVTVTNAGNGPTTASYTVTDTMPTGLTAGVVTSPDAGWNCTASTTTNISCTRTTALAASASTTLNIPVTIASNAPASITNTATVSGGGELVTNNNSGTSTVSVTQISPDLTIAKTANGTFQQGGTASYTVTVTNSGSGPTTASFTVADTMPTGLTMASIATDATWNCTASTSTVLNCTRTTALAAGASSAITLQVSIAANAPASITNTATVSGGGELVTNNNSGSSTVSVTQIAPDLTVTKVAQGSAFQQGGTITYLITVSNGGNGPTTSTVTMQDVMPTGLTATTATGTNWSCTTGATVSCTNSTPIAAGANSVITLSANIAANAPASIINTATVTTAGESNTGNNSGSSVISVTATTNVTITVPVGISYTFDSQTVTGTQTFAVVPGNYTLSTTTPQTLGAGVRAVFSSWSDAGAISHSVTVGSSALAITGNFTTQYQLTTASSPANGGTVTPATGTFFDSGTVVNLTATANAGFVFVNWTGAVANANAAATTVTMDAAKSVTANFVALQAVTVNVPTGVAFTLNSVNYTGSQTVNLAPGTYTLSTTTPQTLGAGVRAVFSSWSDAGAISHSVMVAASAVTITGNFTTQYQLTTAPSPANGGTVTPATGTFFDTGTVVNLTATANAGFAFTNWTGPVANANAAATTVTMDAAKSVTANFVALQAVTVNVPAGVAFTLNSVNYTGSQTVNLAPGTYTLSTTTPQTLGAGVRAVFSSWSDAGAISHSVMVAASAVTITGNFTTQYQLTTAASPSIGGSVVPATGTFFDSGTVVNLTTTANAGFVFSSWTGVVANSATAATTVTMDAAKSVTANFAAQRVFSGPTATGSGVATVVMTTVNGGDNCGFTSAAWVPVSVVTQAPPVGLMFPHGLFDFRAENCVPGSTITLTVTYPQPLASGTTYWKFGPTPSSISALWYGVTSVINGNTLTFSITDGGLGDDDRSADGTIIDQGGPGVFAAPVPTPTLNEWALALLMLGVLGYGLYLVNRRRVSAR